MRPIVLPPKSREAKVAEVAKFLMAAFPGKPVRVKVELARPDKTPAQNRYLWAVPYKLLGEHLGMEAEELHEWNCGSQWGWKDRKCPKTPRNPEGVESVPIRTTTRDENGQPDLCPAEDMAALWERCQRLGANHGLLIPDPDPDYLKKRTTEPDHLRRTKGGE
jgi:hypothetical protein